MWLRQQYVRIGVAYTEFDLEGGESVYCVNERQLRKAREMVEGSTESSARIGEIIVAIDAKLDRNERAALSFLLIHRLLGSRSQPALQSSGERSS